MIELHDVRIMEDYPGKVARYTVDLRFIDPGLGTHESVFGPVYNYDKVISFGADTLDDAVDRIQEVITERLCS